MQNQQQSPNQNTQQLQQQAVAQTQLILPHQQQQQQQTQLVQNQGNTVGKINDTQNLSSVVNVLKKQHNKNDLASDQHSTTKIHMVFSLDFDVSKHQSSSSATRCCPILDACPTNEIYTTY